MHHPVLLSLLLFAFVVAFFNLYGLKPLSQPYTRLKYSLPIQLSDVCFQLSEHGTKKENWQTNWVLSKATFKRHIKVGINLNVDFTPLNIGLTEISRSRFKQYENSMLIPFLYVLGCYVIFLVIFAYIWE